MMKSLRVRLITILLLLTLSMMIVVGTVLVNSITAFYHNDFTKQLESVFTPENLSRFEQAAAGSDGAAELGSRMQRYIGQLGIDSYRNYYILDGNGGFLNGSNEELGRSLEKTENLITAMTGELGNAINSSGNMDYAIPILTEDGNRYIIYVKDSMQEISELSVVLISIIVQTLIAALLIAVLLSFFFARTITNPIENLTAGAQKIAAGDFSEELSVYSDDEIGRLTTTFNEMATVLKNTLDEVNRERSKLETIFLYLTDGVVAFDRQGELLHVNKAAKELFEPGWFEERSTFDALFGFLEAPLPFDELLHLEPEKNVMLNAVVGKRILTIHFAALGYSDGGFPGGLIAVLHDITEQQRLEESRREFIANVSHELRTPLTNIKSYTETVIDGDDLKPADRKRFLGIVNNEADRMGRIVTDLLVLSRLDSQKEEWKIATFPVADLINKACDAMMMEAMKHSHVIHVELEKELPDLTADRGKLEQVIFNILSNAIKYTQDGGNIWIRADRQEARQNLGAEPGEMLLRIRVADDGFGIPKEDLPHLFERFYRVDKARSREKGGTGLGLAIAREIIRWHRGDITVESRLEQGTEFTILLPFVCRLPKPEE